MGPRKLIAVLASTMAFVALGACAPPDSGPDSGTPPPTTTKTSTKTATPSSTETVATEPAQPAPSETECDNPNVGLSETDFGHWLNTTVIPTTEDGTFFHIGQYDDQFDPCAELSYLVVEGENGDVDSPAGTGASLVSTVVFFAQNQLITAPAPIEFSSVVNVERLSDDSLLVFYAYPGGATAGGAGEILEVEYHMEGGQLLGDEQIPAQFHGNLRLDFNEFELPATTSYSMAMGQELIFCNVPEFDGTWLTCADEYGAPWADSMNIVRMNFQTSEPPTTERGNPPQIKSQYPSLSDEAVTKVGRFYFDTRGPNVLIHDENLAYLIGEGIQEQATVPAG